MIKIKVQTPAYDEKSGIANIKLTEQNGAVSNVSTDFRTLLPFANLVDQKIVDFFFITSAVYGIDRFINRKLNSVDGWSREFDVSLGHIKIRGIM